MKHFIIVISACLAAGVCQAAQNKITMVTYFPVPYVAYSQVNASESMDIGLTSVCDMKLGCTSAGYPLKTNKLNLRSGQLDLDGGLGIFGEELELGQGADGLGRISFKNVRIQTGNMQSVTSEHPIEVDKLMLFGKEFPSCLEKDPSGLMSWQKLTLKGAGTEELFLMCGEGKEAENQCPKTPGDPRTRWVESEQKCGCPNVDEYFHNGACCSYSNKDDTRCWSPSSWYGWDNYLVDNPDKKGKPRNCTLVDGKFPYLLEGGKIPEKYANVGYGKNGSACSAEEDAGKKVLASCGTFTMHEGTETYYILSITFGECRSGKGPWFDEKKDTRFECGH